MDRLQAKWLEEQLLRKMMTEVQAPSMSRPSASLPILYKHIDHEAMIIILILSLCIFYFNFTVTLTFKDRDSY